MITSTGNAQVRNIVQLKKKAKERKKQNLYVVEGVRMFSEAPADQIESIYVSASFASNTKNIALLRGKKCEVLADSVFEYVSDTRTPQGILCLVRMKEYRLDDVLRRSGVSASGRTIRSGEAEKTGMVSGNKMPSAGLWLILENLQDPGNLGTMFRTGEGAGIAGVIMDRTTADIYNPKTIRSTMGSVFRVPFYITDDLQETVRQMKIYGIRIFAAHLEGSSVYDAQDYTGDAAFLVGNEGNGLSEQAAGL
ncbi:MAG: RNA methyltransferase, partial [Clostridiales bacterium]|nr:RNA methyltransferase [Clostridiales bacterium]